MPLSLRAHPVVLVVEQIGTGGATRAVFNQASILLEQGFEVTVATVEEERQDFLDKAERAGLRPEGALTRNLPTEWPERWEQVRDDRAAVSRLQVEWLTSLAKSHAEKPFLIAEHRRTITLIQHVSPAVAYRVGLLHNNQFSLSRKSKIPTIADTGREQILGAVWALDALVGLTKHQTNDLRRLVGPWRGRVFDAPNEAHIPAREFPPPEPNRITVVSRLVPIKQVSEILHAFALVRAQRPETVMHIYGGGADKDRLISLSEHLGLQDSVTFHVSTLKPLDAMATGHFGVLTSKSEAMPLTLLESYSVGRPVIAYRFKYGPESMIEDGVTGFVVENKNRAALAGRMIELLDDPDRALRMGAAGRALAQERYSRAQVWKAWEIFLTAAMRTPSWRLPYWMTTATVPIRGNKVPLISAAYRFASRKARREIGW